MRIPRKARRYTASTFEASGESQRILRFIPSKPPGEFVDLGRIAFERAKQEVEARRLASVKKKARRLKERDALERERSIRAKWDKMARQARIMSRNRWLAGAQEPLMIEMKRGGRRIARKSPKDQPAT